MREAIYLVLVDMVYAEVTRSQTPTSEKIRRWAQAGIASADQSIKIFSTRVHAKYMQKLALADAPASQKNNLGEFAIQEAMSDCALIEPAKPSVFLFEDHKIARASFLLPSNAKKVNTRAFLQFLEARGQIESAATMERNATAAGRAFSQTRFP